MFSTPNSDSIREYISGGASAIVLSDAIFNKESISQNNFKEIYQLARLAALQGNEAVEQWDFCCLLLLLGFAFSRLYYV